MRVDRVTGTNVAPYLIFVPGRRAFRSESTRHKRGAAFSSLEMPAKNDHDPGDATASRDQTDLRDHLAHEYDELGIMPYLLGNFYIFIPEEEERRIARLASDFATLVEQAGETTHPRAVELLVKTGTFFFNRNEVARATEYYEHALAVEPNNPFATTNLAIISAVKGNRTRLEQCLHALEDLPRDDPYSALSLAVFFFAIHELDRATALLNRAFATYATAHGPGDLAPGDTEGARFWELALHVLLVRGLADKAVEVVEARVPPDHPAPELRFNAGTALFHHREFARARAHFEHVLDHPKASTFLKAGTCVNLGQLHHEQGDLAAAIEWTERAIEYNPYMPLALQNLALMHVQREEGGFDRAMELFGQCVRLYQENDKREDRWELATVFNITAEVFFGKKDFSEDRHYLEVLGSLERAKEVAPRYLITYLNLILAHGLRGHHETDIATVLEEMEAVSPSENGVVYLARAAAARFTGVTDPAPLITQAREWVRQNRRLLSPRYQQLFPIILKHLEDDEDVAENFSFTGAREKDS